MIKNYFITSLRNLRRNWNFTVINITGLTLGLACCLLIFFTVRYEVSFDKHHQNTDQVYRIIRHTKANGEKGYNPGIPLPVLEAMRNDFPEIKNQVTCTYGMRETLVTNIEGVSKKKFVDPFYAVSFVGPEYFNLLDYTWLKGSPKTSLTNPGSVVLTERQAQKYFGDADPMGKTIRINNKMNFIVTGLIKDSPVTTNFPFTVMLSFSSLKEYGSFTEWNDWISSYGGGQMYIKLPAAISKDQFEKQMVTFSKKYLDAKTAADLEFLLQPVKDIHFATKMSNYAGRTISKGMIWSMVLVGVFILITACVNFVNLATAQALRRSREVGVRKVLGSTRSQLLRQYFSETGVITFLSVILGLVVAQLVLPYVANILNIKSEGVWFIKDPSIIIFLLILMITTTFLAGIYPAMIVSGYQPILALKGKAHSSGSHQSNLRRGLIVLQFAISQAVLIGTLIAYSQMKYFKTMDVGFDKDEIVNVVVPEHEHGEIEKLAAQLKGESGINSISFSSFTPMSQSNWQTGFTFENDTDFLDFDIVMRPADTAWAHTYGLEMIAGRMYFPSDTIREYVVNEAFVQKLGFKSPQEIIGKRMAIGGSDFKLPIVGVVKNFNTFSLHREIIPCVMTTLKDNYGMLSVKLAKNAGKTQIDRIEKVWAATFPDHVFSYTFFDEKLSSFYDKEQKLFDLFRILAGIAIFIGCLGLYGVVAFMAESRTKEMGIRKAIGASALHIFGLFSIDFVKLIIVALVIASPIAWYAMNEWLQDFTYKIEINWSVFVLTGVAVVLIALITISFQSIKAALMNPVKALRSE
ncbi:ABC transporter permease [Dyadobacter psychrotolerans]|uniref:FtsX-like permease family protein n=1 Tax=Dyadobacter psychrotolerans TaxID=2541721 RepID=A0A4R5E1H4_9BACT|nr:ABC transporter permease [Dyadobacter psychrotolerans]TDE18551.1 FtsX-like permease family protein [Dyadobacter psychrotolerans]